VADQLQSLQKSLAVTFSDQSLLRTALVHRSYLNENRSFSLPHNERLEFLGDAVLELIVTDHLYRTYENPEGDLTSWRSALVRGDMLAVVAEDLGIGQAILMSKGEEKSGGRQRGQLLANACEAVIGAVYLDQGYDAAKDLVHRVIIPRLPEIIKEGSDRDPKSTLQEKAQEKFNETPEYVVTSETGPDHDKRFTIEVKLGDNVVGTGKGTSKQQAQQEAARAALKGKLKK
jgi:ribonuclease-3